MQKSIVVLANCSGSYRRIMGTAICLTLLWQLTGCWSPAVKPSVAEIGKFQTVLVVPVESPPLEVIPNLLEQGDPAYRHFQNMDLSFPVRKIRYLTQGGVEIAGPIVANKEQVVISEDEEALQMTLATKALPGWTPSKTLARQAVKQLSASHVKAELSRNYYPLPMVHGERNADLSHWYGAVENWFDQELVPVDYRRMGHYDAVLEVGIGRYRVFEGQTSLQVLVKLIDPVDRQVITRSRLGNFCVDDAGPASLVGDGAAFKQLVANQAELLMKQSLVEIGWHLDENSR